MVHPQHVIDTIAANVRRTRNPFGIPKFLMNRWWIGTGVPRKGKALLFTGMMYQFIPYIERSTGVLAQLEDSPWAAWLRYAKHMPSTLSGIGLAAITPGAEKKRFNRILQDIVKILVASGVDFCYRPELDDYSGVLLYDLGDQQRFAEHARFVAAKLKGAGITQLITVDPHTTYALKELFPKITGETFQVTTYFERLNLAPHATGPTITLHDPCFYGRYLGLSEVPAKALARMGITCVGVRQSGAFTHCCGGPAESISPKLAGQIGTRRLEQLTATGAPLVAMCPICLGNLRKLGADVQDLSTLIAATLA